MTRVAIIDCGAGNLHSVRKALASQLPPAATLEVVTEAAALNRATHVVLPGVGAFADCMRGLDALPGMRAALEETVLHRKVPFLGICVGMQLLFERGYEHGEHQGLGWFQGEVRKIAPQDPALKVPHMGWNRLQVRPLPEPKSKAAHVFAGIEAKDHVYFVHSYAVLGVNPTELLATVDYGGPIVAGIGRKHIIGTQFHPEKSQAVGLRLLRRFVLD